MSVLPVPEGPRRRMLDFSSVGVEGGFASGDCGVVVVEWEVGGW